MHVFIELFHRNWFIKPEINIGHFLKNFVEVIFFSYSYETTSTALAYTTYLIAKHQDVQQRLYEEIKDLIERVSKQVQFIYLN